MALEAQALILDRRQEGDPHVKVGILITSINGPRLTISHPPKTADDLADKSNNTLGDETHVFGPMRLAGKTYKSN